MSDSGSFRRQPANFSVLFPPYYPHLYADRGQQYISRCNLKKKRQAQQLNVPIIIIIKAKLDVLQPNVSVRWPPASLTESGCWDDTEIRRTALHAWAAKYSTLGVSPRPVHEIKQIKHRENNLGNVYAVVISHSKQHFPPSESWEDCILYLRNRHVVILSSLKLWEKGTVSIFVFTKFPLSIYFLRHFDVKVMKAPFKQTGSVGVSLDDEEYSTCPRESWLNEKRKALLKGVFAILSVAVGLANGGQTDLSLAAPLPHGSV